MTEIDPAASCCGEQVPGTTERIERLREWRSPCGTRAAYVRGCRCEACTTANRAYSREREERRRKKLAQISSLRAGNAPRGVCPGASEQGCPSGGWVRKDSPGGLCPACRNAATFEGRVPAERARAHIQTLSRNGVGRRAVAEASGVARTVINAVLAGDRQWIYAGTERRILDVDRGAMADGALVSARKTWKAVGRLQRLGWTKQRISKEIGQDGRALQLGKQRVTLRQEDRVVRLAARAEREAREAKALARAARGRCVRCGHVHDDDLEAAKWCLEHRNVPLTEAEKLRERGGRSAWNA